MDRAFNKLSRKQRIHRVMSLLQPHVPASLLAQVDLVFTELYADLQSYVIKAATPISGTHRVDLEANKIIKLEELTPTEFVLVESPRIAATRQKIFRLAHSPDAVHSNMRFETKKLKNGFHRVTRLT